MTCIVENENMVAWLTLCHHVSFVLKYVYNLML